jgi:hypothetical protein
MPAQTANDGCIGYLETPQLYRHLFYFQNRNGYTTVGPSESHQGNVYSLFDVMQHDPDESVDVEDQLRIAHKTATALLQFHETPWLSDRWRLHDLSYFGLKTTMDEAALKTLHLSSRISRSTATAATANPMDGVEETIGVSDQVRFCRE